MEKTWKEHITKNWCNASSRKLESGSTDSTDHYESLWSIMCEVEHLKHIWDSGAWSLPNSSNYMVSGSQDAACFSNRGEFILRVFSQGFASGSFFLTLLNPATNYSINIHIAWFAWKFIFLTLLKWLSKNGKNNGHMIILIHWNSQ